MPILYKFKCSICGDEWTGKDMRGNKTLGIDYCEKCNIYVEGKPIDGIEGVD